MLDKTGPHEKTVTLPIWLVINESPQVIKLVDCFWGGAKPEFDEPPEHLSNKHIED